MTLIVVIRPSYSVVSVIWIWPLEGYDPPLWLPPEWPCTHKAVRGQSLVRLVYEDSQGSRPLFVHLVTREETRDRIPVIDERREWRWKEGLSGSLRSVSICVCFHGVNGFVGHHPSRSAEVVAASHCGRVGAEDALKLGFEIDLRSAFAGIISSGSKNKNNNKKRKPSWKALRSWIISNLLSNCADAALLWPVWSTVISIFISHLQKQTKGKITCMMN